MVIDSISATERLSFHLARLEACDHYNTQIFISLKLT